MRLIRLALAEGWPMVFAVRRALADEVSSFSVPLTVALLKVHVKSYQQTP